MHSAESQVEYEDKKQGPRAVKYWAIKQTHPFSNIVDFSRGEEKVLSVRYLFTWFRSIKVAFT